MRLHRQAAYLLLSCMVCGLLMVPVVPAQAQDGVNLLPASESVEPAEISEQAGDAKPSTSAVTRLLPEQWLIDSDDITAAPVYLDGYVLFWLRAPAANAQQPVEERARIVQRQIYRAARASLSQPVDVKVSVDESTNQPVIFAGDKMLLTVTDLDAQFSGHTNPKIRAIALVDTLREAFARYQRERQPVFWRRQIKITAALLGGAVVLHLWSLRITKRLQRRQQRLMQTKTQLGQARPLSEEVSTREDISASRDIPFVPIQLGLEDINPASVFELLRARLDNRQKRKLNEAAQGLLLVAQAALWLSVVLVILSLFPYTRWVQVLVLHWIKIPAKILLAMGVAFGLIRLSSLLIDKAGLALEEGAQWAPEQSQRLSLRFSTFSQAAKGVVGAVILAIATVVVLAIAGVQVGPLLTGAGIAGIGISLAAQSLIKDIINGFLILLEDQFGLGDVISTEGVTGTVETLNLRITQLRNSEGRLITIPNSQISVVENLSKDWAQVDLSITVASSMPVDRALGLLQSTAEELTQDPQWQAHILEPPELLGVESIDHSGIALRILIKTQPLKQWIVARELRQRIKQRFDEAGVAIGVPQERIAIHWETSLGKKQNDAASSTTSAEK